MRICWFATLAVMLSLGAGCRKAPPAPALSEVSPNRGPAAGGTAVLLRGQGFAPGLTVQFGDVPAPTVVLSNSSLAHVVTPAHSPGAVRVSVRNPDGQEAALAGAFEFQPPQPDTLLRLHFAGRRAVEADTNGAALKALLALPESRALFNQTLDKLARAPYARLQPRLGAQTNDCAPLLRPLLEDMVRSEWLLEVRGLSNQPPEWALAVQLPVERAALWRTNLATIVTTWTGLAVQPATAAGREGWSLQKHDPPNRVGLAVTGDWVLVGVGQDALLKLDEWAGHITATGRPDAPLSNQWLHCRVDWPRLTGLPNWLAALRLPRTELTAVGNGANLQTRVELVFPQPHGWQAEPWLIPTNLVREPLVSFTAVQGLGRWLKPAADWLGLSPEATPNQACFWALAEIPFQTFVAVPVSDATNVMARLCEKLPPWFNTNSQGRALGRWIVPTNRPAIVWDGMPFFGGFLRPAHEETSHGFLFAGLFPNTPKKVAPPPELFLQILGRTNLVCYDWEIGGERMLAWRNMSQLALLLANKPQLPTESLAMKWMQAISTNFGNVGTSLVVTGPDRMTLTRESPFGLTGLETVLLANWLESVKFPWAYELPGSAWPKRRDRAGQPKPRS